MPAVNRKIDPESVRGRSLEDALPRALSRRARRTRFRQQPTQRLIQIRQRNAFNGIIVMSIAHRDHAFFSCVRVNHKSMKAWRDDFIFFRKQENRWCVGRFRICNTVELSRDLPRDWPGQQPQVPPAELPQDHFADWRWILQN